MGFRNGLLSIDAPGICSIQFPKETMRFIPDLWYDLGITFDGAQLIVYLDGFRAATPTCTIAPVASSNASYDMGVELEAYFRRVLLYSVALTAEEMHAGFLNGPERLDACAAWFDFSGTEIVERSGHHAPVSVKGFAGIVNIARVLTAEGGLVLYTPYETVHPGAEGYTWTAKIYPLRTNNGTMCIAANSDADRTTGWMLYMQKESDDVFRLCLRMGGANGTVLTADKTIETFRWTDAAWVYDGRTVRLYVDGELAGSIEGVAEESLQGDGRTTYCGVMKHGKADAEFAYSGYVAQISEFRRVVADDALKNFMVTQPYVLDEGIAAVFDFTDENPAEKCTFQTYSLSGRAAIAWVENTNRLDDPQRVSIALPDDEAYWDSLSDEQRWEVELFGTICNSYLCDVLGYRMDESEALWYRSAAPYIVANVLPMPEFRKVVDSGSSVDEKLLCALGGAAAATGLVGTMGAVIGAVCKGAAFIGAALSSSFFFIIAGATIAVIITITAVVMIVRVVQENRDRPNNRNLLDFSIEFNHMNNPATGGIHIRRNRQQSVVPPEWSMLQNNRNNPALCAYIVPMLQVPHIVVRILYRTDVPLQISLSANEQQGGLLGNIQSPVFNLLPNEMAVVEIQLPANRLNENPNALFPAVTKNWEWHCHIGGEDIFLTNTFHRAYRLLGQPIMPWRFQDEGVYDPGAINYPWTEAMDVATAMHVRGAPHGENANDLLACLANGLHFDGRFVYDVITHYVNNNGNFRIDQFQHDFNNPGGGQHVLNCVDCATIVASYANLHGVGLWQLNLVGQHDVMDEEGNILHVEESFEFNPIKAIGFNDLWLPNDPNGLHDFDFHRVACRQNNMMDWAHMLITDGCLQLDMGDFPHGNDIAHKNPRVPVDLVFTEVNDYEVNIDEDQPYHAAFYRERLVRNKNICFPNHMVMAWGLSGEMNVHREGNELITRCAERNGISLDLSDAGFRVHEGSFTPEAAGLQLLRSEPQSPRYMSYTCLYRGSEIGIDCIECENPSERNYMLAAFLSGVTVKLPAACDLGIALGDDAFVRMTGEGCTYIAMCRKNIVLQLMCNTSDSVDLLPLATELDRQLHDN